MKKLMLLLLLGWNLCHAQTGCPPGLVAGCPGAGTTIIRVQMSDYLIDSSGPVNIVAYARGGTGLSDIVGTDFRTVCMAAYTALCPNTGIQNTVGGWIAIGNKHYTVTTDALKFVGWEGGNAPYSQFRFTGSGTSSTITGVTSGKNTIELSGNICVSIENMQINNSTSAGASCIRSDTTATIQTSFSGSHFINLKLTNSSSTAPAMFLRNWFTLKISQMKIVGNNYTACILENSSTHKIYYGNSTFDEFECTTNNFTYPHAGLIIRSTNDSSRLDHITITTYYCYGGYHGIIEGDCEDIIVNTADIESPVHQPILVGAETPLNGMYHWAKGNSFHDGTLLSAAGAPCIINGTKGFGNHYDWPKVLPGDNTTALFTDSSNSNMLNIWQVRVEFPGINNPFIQRSASTLSQGVKWDGTKWGF